MQPRRAAGHRLGEDERRGSTLPCRLRRSTSSNASSGTSKMLRLSLRERSDVAARGVDEDVDPAPLVERPRRARRAPRVVQHVGDDHHRLGAGRANLFCLAPRRRRGGGRGWRRGHRPRRDPRRGSRQGRHNLQTRQPPCRSDRANSLTSSESEAGSRRRTSAILQCSGVNQHVSSGRNPYAKSHLSRMRAELATGFDSRLTLG